jgi:hypothetical protein
MYFSDSEEKVCPAERSTKRSKPGNVGWANASSKLSGSANVQTEKNVSRDFKDLKSRGVNLESVDRLRRC